MAQRSSFHNVSMSPACKVLRQRARAERLMMAPESHSSSKTVCILTVQRVLDHPKQRFGLKRLPDYPVRIVAEHACDVVGTIAGHQHYSYARVRILNALGQFNA